jgi:hypothetical protein
LRRFLVGGGIRFAQTVSALLLSLCQFSVQRLRAHTDLLREVFPFAFRGYLPKPAFPRAQSGFDCFEGQQFSPKSRVLNFVSQMRHEGFSKNDFFPKPFAEPRSRNAVDSCCRLGNGVAVVSFGEQRSLCDDPARPRSLQYDRATILIGSNEMRLALEYQVESPDGVSKVEKMLTWIERMPGAIRRF